MGVRFVHFGPGSRFQGGRALAGREILIRSEAVGSRRDQ